MIPFHQYQRYKLAEILINSMRSKNASLNLLEVGANQHKNLQKFLPKDSIKFMDIELPQELLNDPSFILGDATNIELEDNAYDVVIALDVLEHIEKSKRTTFIKEIFRVSSEYVILSAPFANAQNKLAEQRVAAFYKTLFGREMLWQKEHELQGLPLLNETLNFIESELGITPFIVNHGDVFLWEKMMNMEYLTGVCSELTEYWYHVNEFYNKNVFLNDFCEIGVRSFVILPKKEKYVNVIQNEVIQMAEKSADTRGRDQLIGLENNFYNLYSALQKKNQQNNASYYAQVFIDNGWGFAENNSIKIPLEHNKVPGIVDLELELGNLSVNQLKKIRLDPINTSCIVKIHEITIISIDGNIHKIEELDSNENYQLLASRYFFTIDPQLTLSLDDSFRPYKLRAIVEYIDIELKTKFIEELFDELSQLQNQKSGIELLQKETQELLDTTTTELKIVNDKLEMAHQELDAWKSKFMKEKETSISFDETIKTLEAQIKAIESTFAWKVTHIFKSPK